jgi:hypothetical protein
MKQEDNGNRQDGEDTRPVLATTEAIRELEAGGGESFGCVEELMADLEG